MLKSMQQVAGSNTIGASPFCRAQLLRPVYQQHSRHTPHRPSFVGGALQPRTRHQHICSATDSEQNSQDGNENDVRPEVSKTKLAGKGDDNEVPKLGLAGTIVTWALLVVRSTYDAPNCCSGL